MSEEEVKTIVEIVVSSIVEPLKEYIDTKIENKLNEYNIKSIKGSSLKEEISASFKKDLFGNMPGIIDSSTKMDRSIIADMLGESSSVSSGMSNDFGGSNDKSEYYADPTKQILDLVDSVQKINESTANKNVSSILDLTEQDFSKFL
jgi:hypothetical protein